jgi:hypothetical protein
MNRQEAAQVIEMRQLLWPHTPEAADPVVEVDLWATFFAGDDAEVVAGALRLRAKNGERFAPSPGEVEALIRPTPTYADCLTEFIAMSRAGYSSHGDPSIVPWSHPLIRAAAEDGLFREWGLSPDPKSDPDLIQSAAAFRAHFRESFKGVAARRLAQVELPALTGRTREQIEGRGQRQIEGE